VAFRERTSVGMTVNRARRRNGTEGVPYTVSSPSASSQRYESSSISRKPTGA
jgi:hypothetical protein